MPRGTKKHEWVTEYPGPTGSDWPQCIWRKYARNGESPIWVWGDSDLAALIVRLLNEHERKETK